MPVDVQAAIAAQTRPRTIRAFRRFLAYQDALTGVVVKYVSGHELARRVAEGESGDPLRAVLRDADATSLERSCSAHGIDLSSSLAALAAEHEVDGAAGRAGVLVAWHVPACGASPTGGRPRCVGVATLYTFKPARNFNTLPESMDTDDFATLRSYMDGHHLYIDHLCSVRPAVGRVLALHAYARAIATDARGLVAVAYASTPRATPSTKRMYTASLGFTPIVASAQFTVADMHGAWMLRTTESAAIADMVGRSVHACVRGGMSMHAAGRLLSRR